MKVLNAPSCVVHLENKDKVGVASRQGGSGIKRVKTKVNGTQILYLVGELTGYQRFG